MGSDESRGRRAVAFLGTSTADYEDGKLTKEEMRPGDVVHVTPKTVHRMTAIEDCDVLEVSTPELDDVVRIEDRYGRIEKT